jgi:hypothetical protein
LSDIWHCFVYICINMRIGTIYRQDFIVYKRTY